MVICETVRNIGGISNENFSVLISGKYQAFGIHSVIFTIRGTPRIAYLNLSGINKKNQ